MWNNSTCLLSLFWVYFWRRHLLSFTICVVELPFFSVFFTDFTFFFPWWPHLLVFTQICSLVFWSAILVCHFFSFFSIFTSSCFSFDLTLLSYNLFLVLWLSNFQDKNILCKYLFKFKTFLSVFSKNERFQQLIMTLWILKSSKKLLDIIGNWLN